MSAGGAVLRPPESGSYQLLSPGLAFRDRRKAQVRADTVHKFTVGRSALAAQLLSRGRGRGGRQSCVTLVRKATCFCPNSLPGTDMSPVGVLCKVLCGGPRRSVAARTESLAPPERGAAFRHSVWSDLRLPPAGRRMGKAVHRKRLCPIAPRRRRRKSKKRSPPRAVALAAIAPRRHELCALSRCCQTSREGFSRCCPWGSEHSLAMPRLGGRTWPARRPRTPCGFPRSACPP
jgi:hypothetical protein